MLYTRYAEPASVTNPTVANFFGQRIVSKTLGFPAASHSDLLQANFLSDFLSVYEGA